MKTVISWVDLSILTRMLDFEASGPASAALGSAGDAGEPFCSAAAPSPVEGCASGAAD
jgi:hypothetical protein